MQDFRKLLVWQKAHDLSLRADELAQRIAPRKPKLASQLERAADSVPALIAEGRGRGSDADFAHYVTMAIGSITEVENHLIRAYDGKLIPQSDFDRLTERSIEIRKMLLGLRKALRNNRQPRDRADTPNPHSA